ncbi:MAG: response regulator transcription factor [Gemmatimonadales bacterium]
MTLRVLMFEDREQDAELAVEHLKRFGFAVVDQRVDSKSAYERALSTFAPGLVLCDRGVPQYSALDALRAAKSLKPAVPFLVVTGAIDEEALVSCLGGGADDVVLKSNLSRLNRAVREALDRRAALHTLSPRQLEVLLLVVAGRTTREIADKLGLSLKTAETHRITMMKRLGIHDVAGLVRYAVKVRLIAPDGG